MYCWICSNFSAYTSYLELVFALNVLLGTWWGKFRQQALVDREAERDEGEILLERGSDAENRVAAIFDKRERLDERTRRAGGICGATIGVLILASLLLVDPSEAVPTWMKWMFVVSPLVLPAMISYAVLRNRTLRRDVKDVMLADLKERKKVENDLSKTSSQSQRLSR